MAVVADILARDHLVTQVAARVTVNFMMVPGGSMTALGVENLGIGCNGKHDMDRG